jgi:excisionase family DNA binding protein
MRNYFTTNDVAKICSVTRQTVINWIKAGKLYAISTPGRHRRVIREDLLKFIENSGFDPSLVEIYEDTVGRQVPFCWEYQTRGFGKAGSSHLCDMCIVKKAKALNCHILAKEMDISRRYCLTSCEECRYYRKYIILK